MENKLNNLISKGSVHFVFGPQGAGKSTYSRKLARLNNGTRFSIDDWMIQLYGPDLPKPLNLNWIMERVKRCEQQIWSTAKEIALNGGNTVLDLGFIKASNRAEFLQLAQQADLSSELHYVIAPHDERRRRVLARNVEKGETFAFEVTPTMFDYMEKETEAPSEAELSNSSVFNTYTTHQQ